MDFTEIITAYSKNYMKHNYMSARGSVVVDTLCYEPEGRGFKIR
jgi:hypothetical protein